MSRLPLVEKNAYLTIHVTHNSICANLSYSHYDIGRHYILHDETYFDPEHDETTEQAFWDEYFSSLMDSFGWKFIISTDTRISMGEIIDFVDEGNGVSGISFIFHNAVNNRVGIMSVLHSYLPTAELFVETESELIKFLPDLTSKLGYKSLIYLNADLEIFDIININLFNDRGQKEKKASSTKIYWENKDSLIRSINDKKIKAFSSVDMDAEENVNLWANYLTRVVTASDNYELHDMLRSFLTVQLSTILNNKPEITLNNAEGSISQLVVIDGLLARLLDDKEIIISLLDGLQMKGDFDLFIDTDSRFIPFGRKFVEGINTKNYIVPISSVMNNLRYVAVLENPSNKVGKAVYSGEFIDQKNGRRDLYVLSSEFREFNFKVENNERVVFTGRTMQGSKIFGVKSRENVLVSDPEEKIYDSLFIDARIKPIVYGPDYRVNKDKLKVWKNE